jgi:hypothetical protein
VRSGERPESFDRTDEKLMLALDGVRIIDMF